MGCRHDRQGVKKLSLIINKSALFFRLAEGLFTQLDLSKTLFCIDFFIKTLDKLSTVCLIVVPMSYY